MAIAATARTLSQGAQMTTQFHERDQADVDEMSGLMLLLAVLAIAGLLVFFCT